MDDRRKNYRQWDATQNCQASVSRREALPEDDLVFFLTDLIPQTDLTPFHQYYARELRGQPPFDVTMMVTLLVYAYSIGVCSSRMTPLTSGPSVTFARSTGRHFGTCSSKCCAWPACWAWSNLGTWRPTARRWERTPHGTRR